MQYLKVIDSNLVRCKLLFSIHKIKTNSSNQIDHKKPYNFHFNCYKNVRIFPSIQYNFSRRIFYGNINNKMLYCAHVIVSCWIYVIHFTGWRMFACVFYTFLCSSRFQLSSLHNLSLIFLYIASH